MSEAAPNSGTAPASPAPPKAEAMPFNIYCIQPGGGGGMTLELVWGKVRRWWLRAFCPKYVAEMKARLKGDRANIPVDVIDSRDLKYYRNVANCWVEPADDLYAWRKNIPMATDGWFELLIFALPPFLLAHLFFWYLGGWWNLITVPLVVLGLFVISFFRDPHRLIPPDADAIVSPADGKVVDVTEVVHKGVAEEPIVRIGIFLSVFNVHVNRAPLPGRVLKLKYQQGQFLDARSPDASLQNENLEVVFAEASAPYRRFAVRQVAGAIARRIVCELRPDQNVERGQRYGMIKFGSRTELFLPKSAVALEVQIGQKVKGGSTILGRWKVATPDDFRPKPPKQAVAPKGPPPVEEEHRAPPPISVARVPPTYVPPASASAPPKPPAEGYGLASS